MATIAKETGWAMRFILWELPYATGLGIIHAAGVRRGVTMELVALREEREVEQRDGMREAFEAMRARYSS